MRITVTTHYPTLPELLNNKNWEVIFINSMLNFFPFEKTDINRIGYEKLYDNSNAEWDIDTVHQFIRRCDNNRSYGWLGILSNKKFMWDDNLLEKLGISSYDWVYSWLSDLSNVKWTNSFIIKHKKEFDWGKLTLNPNIQWTESLLFEVENHIIWTSLIGNPNVRWSKKVVERVNKELELRHAYAVNYSFYKEYVDLAISKGYRPFSTYNLLENAFQYLNQFKLIRLNDEFYKTVWDALSKNPYIPWTAEDLRILDKIDLDKIFYSKNKLPLELDDFIYLEKNCKHSHSLVKIELENESFWTPETIKKLYSYEEDPWGTKGYFLTDLIAYNDSIKWNLELFIFIKDNTLYYDYEAFENLSQREKFFEWLNEFYGGKKLLDYFNSIYDNKKTY